MSGQVGQGENSESDRKASMNVEKAPGKNLKGGTVPVSQGESYGNVGSKATGNLGYKSFDH